MVASHHFTRLDTLELKEFIYKSIGHQRAEKYFDQLKRFLSLKISKAEFDGSCIQTIGRENIPLHNRLIRSILQNACLAKVPPRKARSKVEGLNVKVTNGYQRNCLQSLYGDAFPQSPRKCRSPVNRKFRDRPSPLGPLGKSPSMTCDETVTRTQEQQSATELHSLCSRPPVSVEDGEEVEQIAGGVTARNWSPVTAPFGVSVGSRNKIVNKRGYNDDTFGNICENSGELLDSRTLRGCLEKKLASEGVGISLECADLINNSLDIFLKRLIEPCVGIASSKCRNSNNLGGESNKAVRPGVFPGRTHVSMQDFRVAMESNPRLLGEDWPVQLEKICHYASEE